MSPMDPTRWMRDSGGCAFASGNSRASISASWGVWAPPPKQESSSEEEEEEWQGVAVATFAADSDSKGAREALSGHTSDPGCAPRIDVGSCFGGPSVWNAAAQGAPAAAPVPHVREDEGEEVDEDVEAAEGEESEDDADEKEKDEEDCNDLEHEHADGLVDGDEHRERDEDSVDEEQEDEEQETYEEEGGTTSVAHRDPTGCKEAEKFDVGMLRDGNESWQGCPQAFTRHDTSNDHSTGLVAHVDTPEVEELAETARLADDSATKTTSSAEEDDDLDTRCCEKADGMEQLEHHTRAKHASNEREKDVESDREQQHEQDFPESRGEDEDSADDQDEDKENDQDGEEPNEPQQDGMNDVDGVRSVDAAGGGGVQFGDPLQHGDSNNLNGQGEDGEDDLDEDDEGDEDDEDSNKLPDASKDRISNNWAPPSSLESVQNAVPGHVRLAEMASDREKWVYNDGGRAEAGFLGQTGDCVTRAMAIASQRSYNEVYTFVNAVKNELKKNGDAGFTHKPKPSQKRKWRSLGDARRGVAKPLYDEVMHRMGWVWTATMAWGTGCKTHLKAEDLPSGRLVCRVTKHMVAVIDGMIHDTYDASRGGTRCVYGYFSPGPSYSATVPLESLLSPSATGQRAEAPQIEPARSTPRKAPQIEPARSTPQKPLPASQVVSIDDSPEVAAPQRRQRRVPNYGRATLARQIVCGFSDDDSDEDVKSRCKRRRAQQQLLRGGA